MLMGVERLHFPPGLPNRGYRGNPRGFLTVLRAKKGLLASNPLFSQYRYSWNYVKQARERVGGSRRRCVVLDSTPGAGAKQPGTPGIRRLGPGPSSRGKGGWVGPARGRPPPGGTHCPICQTLTILSAEPEMISRESPETATEYTCFLCPLSTISVRWVWTFHKRTVRSRLPLTR